MVFAGSSAVYPQKSCGRYPLIWVQIDYIGWYGRGSPSAPIFFILFNIYNQPNKENGRDEYAANTSQQSIHQTPTN